MAANGGWLAAAGWRLASAANGGRDFPANRGLHFAADGGTGLRIQVELRRSGGVGVWVWAGDPSHWGGMCRFSAGDEQGRNQYAQ